jgi:hypothetical protein
VLGSGSLGTVYAGTLAGQRVAVKQFRSRTQGQDSFLREVAVAAAVQHDQLLRILTVVRPRRARVGAPARPARGPGVTLSHAAGDWAGKASGARGALATARPPRAPAARRNTGLEAGQAACGRFRSFAATWAVA